MLSWNKLNITFLYGEVQNPKLSDTQTVLRQCRVWSLASRLDLSDSASSRDKKPDTFCSVVHFNNSERLGNILVLLLSENITATYNKQEWETGKPKNVEISASLGMRKLALKSICATFSPVTPLFLLISEKLVSSTIRKCSLFKILSD